MPSGTVSVLRDSGRLPQVICVLVKEMVRSDATPIMLLQVEVVGIHLLQHKSGLNIGEIEVHQVIFVWRNYKQLQEPQDDNIARTDVLADAT